MSRLPVPIVVLVTGEGGSGGALALAVGDRVFMLENSIYSVISPEGCAAILWNDTAKAEEAAGAMRITAQEIHALGIVDGVIPEPLGGAHRDREAMADTLRETIRANVAELRQIPTQRLLENRLQKFLNMGAFAQE
jgi:acetyl-CoA carboxylase carboxyl transferase subunit alpha